MKLRLENREEGWFWNGHSIILDVIGEAWGHSRLYYRIRLDPPVGTHRVAWVSSRWVGHELSPTEDSTALLWLVPEEDPAPPCADTDYSARVSCRMLG